MDSLTLLLASIIPVFIVASRMEGERRWWGLVPLLHFFLLVRTAASSRWWVLALILPVVHFLVMGLLWGRVATRTGQPRWLGWCAVLPIAGLIAIWVIALRADGPVRHDTLEPPGPQRERPRGRVHPPV